MIVAEDPYLYRFPNINDYFHYERPKNFYFPYTASNSNPSDKARFEGITPSQPPVYECMCCLRCMFGCCILP